jgi:putative peptide zinc metalloprotease protein
MSHRNHYLAAASRRLPLRMRAELKIVPQPSSRGTRYVIKDGVAQRYWHVRADEAFLLQSLDGRTSADELCARFAKQFAPRRLTAPELNGYLARLHQEGLIVADQPGQAEAILDRQRAWRRNAPLRFISQLLAWRFRGVDPDCWLARVTPRLSWLFTIWAAAFFVILVASALLLVLLHWPAVDRELAALAGLFTTDQVLLVLVAIGLAKVFHELGHAIACKHFGGECHEIGFLLLLGAPSLYCNVSDAWLLPEKRPRVLISAAGMIVELALAAICAWLWWCTYPGLIHSLALSAMVVCSVNTLLLNGNPLLQYDGYYILADLTDTPNLRAVSRAVVRRLFARAVLGLRIEAEIENRGREPWLVVYGIASIIYRCLMVIGIWWFLHGVLEPYGAELLGWIIGGLLSAALVIEPAVDTARFFLRPGWDREVPWPWVLPRNALLVTGCLALLIVPLPASVVAPVVLEPRDGRAVYVEVEGRLAWAIATGARVNAGDVIVRLENLPLKAELAQLSGEREVKRQQLRSLLRRQADPQAAAQIPTAEKSLADVDERLRQRDRDFERLVIRAPCAGVVLPPPPRKDVDQPVPGWTGAPLDPENFGCHLKTGDVVCIVGEPQTMDALAFVAQGQEDLVRSGQAVKLLVDSFPDRQFVGTVEVPATTRAHEVPEELVVRGEVPVERDRVGKPQPNQPIFTARIELAALEQPLLIAATGRAKIAVAPRSLASRLWRSLSQTFRAP